jgi:hypothetical protein
VVNQKDGARSGVKTQATVPPSFTVKMPAKTISGKMVFFPGKKKRKKGAVASAPANH